MAKPLVSVVIPALDVSPYLARCLDSLLAQSHRPLEIIVVNDGSTDATAKLLRSYAAAHPEIHAIHQLHRGLGPARNAALSVASGEFVAFVDADDWVEPDFVADLLGIATATGADAVACNFSFDFWGLRLAFPFFPKEERVSGEEAGRLSLHMTRFPAFAWNKLYRRSLFQLDPAPFPNIFYEDLATTFRVLSRAKSVALTPNVYYHYCLRTDSITGSFGVRNVFAFAAAIDIVRRDLNQSGRWESWRPTYRRLLRQALVMMSIQVLLQRNEIPLRARPAVLARYYDRLRWLAKRPTDGRRTRTVRLTPAVVASTIAQRVVSSTRIVD